MGRLRFVYIPAVIRVVGLGVISKWGMAWLSSLIGVLVKYTSPVLVGVGKMMSLVLVEVGKSEKYD